MTERYSIRPERAGRKGRVRVRDIRLGRNRNRFVTMERTSETEIRLPGR